MLRVLAKGNTRCQFYEANAAEAITPGHLITLNGSGNAIKHNVAGAAAAAGAQYVGPTRFALERDQWGLGIDDAYAANDQVLYAVCPSGVQVEALVAAGAAAIAYGDSLESAGNGTLRKTVVAANAVAVAREALDNSGGGSAARILAEVL